MCNYSFCFVGYCRQSPRFFLNPAGKLLCLIAGSGRLLPLLQNFDERVGVPHRSTRDGVSSLIPRAEQPHGHPNRKVFALAQT
jgi:hypothetical protein